jgi:hypothetical protein
MPGAQCRNFVPVVIVLFGKEVALVESRPYRTSASKSVWASPIADKRPSVESKRKLFGGIPQTR